MTAAIVVACHTMYPEASSGVVSDTAQTSEEVPVDRR